MATQTFDFLLTADNSAVQITNSKNNDVLQIQGGVTISSITHADGTISPAYYNDEIIITNTNQTPNIKGQSFRCLINDINTIGGADVEATTALTLAQLATLFSQIVGETVVVDFPTGSTTFTTSGACASGSGLVFSATVSGGAIALGAATITTAGTAYPASTTFTLPVSGNAGSGALVMITTNSSGVPTAAVITLAGSGYTNGSPTTGFGATTAPTGTIAADTYTSVVFETSPIFTGVIKGLPRNASNFYGFVADLGKKTTAITYSITTGSIALTFTS